MKKSRIGIILASSTLLSLSTIPVAGVTSIKNMNTTSQINTNLQDTSSSITTNTTIEMRLNKDYQKLDWYGKNFSNTVTESQLKQLLSPNILYDVNWGVNILTPTGTALSDGYVEFTVYQIKNNFSNGVTTQPSNKTDKVESATTTDGRVSIEAPSSIKYTDGKDPTSAISMKAYSNDGETKIEINGQSIQKKYVWTTKNISGLFLKHKYNFGWNNNEQIGDFLQATTKKTLTPQDVYSNMISTSKKTDILPSDTVSNSNIIKFSQETLESKYGIKKDDATKYGIGLVTVNFSSSSEGNQAEKWSSNEIPNVEMLVRGLIGSNEKKEVMHFNTDDNINGFLNVAFDVSKIKKANPSFKIPSNANSTSTTVKVSDFTPTELINALLASNSGSSNLLNLLTTKTYLEKSSDLPPLYLTYMGKTMFDTTTTTNSKDSTAQSYQWNGTGLYQMGSIPSSNNGVINYKDTKNAANDSKITNITASADDANGTLYLTVTYNKYNVFQNVVEMGDKTSIVITGLQSDDSASAGNENLYFQWKAVDDLLFSNANDVMTLYNNNKNSTDYLKTLSNTFFEGSSNTYNLDREVKFENNGNSLTITLTFPQFGNVKKLVLTNTYTLTNVSQSSAGITFKDQVSVSSTITKALSVSGLSQATPKEVIDALANGKLDINDFYTGNSSSYKYSTIVTQSDTNDGIVVNVTASKSSVTYASSDGSDSSYTFTTFYTGMAKSVSSSYIYNYAFSDSTNTELQTGLQKLKTIPIDKISVQDVYDNYVSKLPVYSGTNKISVSLSDVSISKDLKNNSITVSILVPLYNSSTNTDNANRTFSTTLTGFLSVNQNNNNSNSKVKNLTVPLAVSFSLTIVAIMTGLLIHLIIKRKKLSKSKINLREVKSKTKTTSKK